MGLPRITKRIAYRGVALLVVIAAASVGISLALASTPPSAQFTVQGTTVGPPVPNGFVGLSMEFRGLEAYAGADPSAVSPPFLQLLRNLAPGQNPVLRIGGDGTDWTWYPVAHMAQPGGVKYSLNKTWLKVARAVAQSVHGKLMLGINLEADSRRLASVEAQAFVNGIGRQSIEALEIGNEPELYGSFPWFKNAAGVHVRGRPHGYDFQDYKQDFSSFAVRDAERRAGRSQQRLQGVQRRAGLVPERRAAGPAGDAARLPTQALQRLQPSHRCAADLPGRLGRPGRRSGRLRGGGSAARPPGRIDEMNGVSCGGVRGVSNSFASALWASTLSTSWPGWASPASTSTPSPTPSTR